MSQRERRKRHVFTFLHLRTHTSAPLRQAARAASQVVIWCQTRHLLFEHILHPHSHTRANAHLLIKHFLNSDSQCKDSFLADDRSLVILFTPFHLLHQAGESERRNAKRIFLFTSYCRSLAHHMLFAATDPHTASLLTVYNSIADNYSPPVCCEESEREAQFRRMLKSKLLSSSRIYGTDFRSNHSFSEQLSTFREKDRRHTE